jgi:hypothetical protein
MSTKSLLFILLSCQVPACTSQSSVSVAAEPEPSVADPKADSFDVNGLVPVVSPLLEANWGQDGDYQSKTPRKDGAPTYPGCTTVASAQILYYYRHQDRANQSVYYTLEHAPLTGHDVVDDGRALFVDLPEYTYDYEAMPLTLNRASPAEIDATATFIYHVGATMNAQFGGGEGSTATGRQLENAFRYQWGYNSISRRQMSIIGKDAFLYDDDEWAEVIRGELDAGRPVLYMARQEDADAGHAFVIDGYATNGLVHVNWGWAGRGNGWYDVNTLEDPYGRRWIRDAMIFRGLEPAEGRAAELLAQRQGGSIGERQEYSWNGTLSLISYTSGTTSGYGLTQDETAIHPGTTFAPVVFLQWEVDSRDGTRVEISADGMDQASITYGVWNDRHQDRLYRNVSLPFVVDPARDGLSTVDGMYYVFAIAFDESPGTTVSVYADLTDAPASAATSEAASPLVVEGRVWHGNGSVICATSGTTTGYGLTMDEAMIHPSNDHTPVVFFQWEIDGRDGAQLQLDAGDTTAATIRYGHWNDRSRDVSRSVSLPYTIDPAADGLSVADGEYYVVMVALAESPTESTSVVATAVQPAPL